MLGARQYRDLLTDYIKAGSRSCSPEVLAALAHSEIDRIRLRVAENPRTPEHILEVLATDKNADVRVAVGINPSTHPLISYQFAFDEDPNVRLGLAEDINTPIELLEKLTEDSNPYVSCRAAQTKDIVLSQGKSRTYRRQFIRWLKKGMTEPELRYA